MKILRVESEWITAQVCLSFKKRIKRNCSEKKCADFYPAKSCPSYKVNEGRWAFPQHPSLCWCSTRLSRKLQAGFCVFCTLHLISIETATQIQQCIFLRLPTFVSRLSPPVSVLALPHLVLPWNHSDGCASCSQQYFCLKPISDPLLLWPLAICVAFFSPN